jgi:hypothetical protein
MHIEPGALQIPHRRNDMKKIFAIIALSLLSTGAFADPCLDANVSPEGYTQQELDLVHVDEEGC